MITVQTDLYCSTGLLVGMVYTTHAVRMRHTASALVRMSSVSYVPSYVASAAASTMVSEGFAGSTATFAARAPQLQLLH